jgi:hypothetical protein
MRESADYLRPRNEEPSQNVRARHLLCALGCDQRSREFGKEVRISVKLKVNRRRYPWIVPKLLAKTRKAAINRY